MCGEPVSKVTGLTMGSHQGDKELKTFRRHHMEIEENLMSCTYLDKPKMYLFDTSEIG